MNETMITFHNLTIVGTSHISRQSIHEVKEAITQTQPQIIALELDQNRFLALTAKKKQKNNWTTFFSIGVKGYLFLIIGAYIQKKLGKIVNIQPGSEMLTAINLAKKNKLKIALIDQPIEITLRRFSQEFTWKEKTKIMKDLFLGILVPQKQLRRYDLEQFDLSSVPSKKTIETLIKIVKKEYPSIYKVLIEERNHYLANRLFHLMKNNPGQKIMAVVGAGHEAEVINILSKKVM